MNFVRWQTANVITSPIWNLPLPQHTHDVRREGALVISHADPKNVTIKRAVDHYRQSPGAYAWVQDEFLLSQGVQTRFMVIPISHFIYLCKCSAGSPSQSHWYQVSWSCRRWRRSGAKWSLATFVGLAKGDKEMLTSCALVKLLLFIYLGKRIVLSFGHCLGISFLTWWHS